MRKLFLCCICLFSSWVLASPTVHISAFTVSSQPFSGKKTVPLVIDRECYANRYKIDKADMDSKILAFVQSKTDGMHDQSEIDKQLSSDSAAYEFKRLYPQVIKNITEDYNCALAMKYFKLKGVPAVVFGDGFIVYDETDLHRAYAAYQVHLERSKGNANHQTVKTDAS